MRLVGSLIFLFVSLGLLAFGKRSKGGEVLSCMLSQIT